MGMALLPITLTLLLSTAASLALIARRLLRAARYFHIGPHSVCRTGPGRARLQRVLNRHPWLREAPPYQGGREIIHAPLELPGRLAVRRHDGGPHLLADDRHPDAGLLPVIIGEGNRHPIGNPCRPRHHVSLIGQVACLTRLRSAYQPLRRYHELAQRGRK